MNQMADVPAKPIREENGRLYVGEPERAYLVDIGWTMFITIRQIRYQENYDFQDGGVVLKRSVVATMSFDMDDVRVLGAEYPKLRANEESPIQIAPTTDIWIPSAIQDHNWTFQFAWYQSFFGMLSLPTEVFDDIAQKVLAKQIDSLSIQANGGFWADEQTAKYMPERIRMTRYLRPGKGGRTDNPDSALCNVTGLSVMCGREPMAAPTQTDNNNPADRVLGAIEAVAASNQTVANAAVALSARSVTLQTKLLPLLAAMCVLLAYIAIWK